MVPVFPRNGELQFARKRATVRKAPLLVTTRAYFF
jgi:hypothetical protein